jgi:hypothetical protein
VQRLSFGSVFIRTDTFFISVMKGTYGFSVYFFQQSGLESWWKPLDYICFHPLCFCMLIFFLGYSWFSMLSMCLQANAEMVPKFPSCYYMPLM